MKRAANAVAPGGILASCAFSVVAGRAGIASAQQGAGSLPRIEVTSKGGLFVIDATLIAPVTLAQAWEVLTDFDAMSQYVPDLESSRVIACNGARLQVEQSGVMRWGLLSHRFQTVREIELSPLSQVSSRVVSGTIPRADTLTRLAAVESGTEIRHHIELVSPSWLPDFALNALLRNETRVQFEALSAEMLRRRDPATGREHNPNLPSR